MCIEAPGRVVEVPAGQTDVARVDVDGVLRTVQLPLLEGGPPSPGEWLSIHLGFAVARLTDEEAHAALAFLRGGDEDDLHALLDAVPSSHQPDEGSA